MKHRILLLRTAVWLLVTVVACGSTRSPIVGTWKNQEAIANQCDPVGVSIAFHSDGTFEDVSRVPASQWMVPIYPKCDPEQWKLTTHTGTFAADTKTIHFTNATGTVTTMFYQLADDHLTIDVAESLDRDPMHYTCE